MSYSDFVSQTVATLSALPPCSDVLGAALAHGSLQHVGTWCEFGVATGTTLARIAAARGAAQLWGFDSFRGLPEDWREANGKGQFAQESIKLPPDGVQLMVGLFADTLPCWRPRSPITFVHFDADLYSSTHAALDSVAQYMAPGAVVVFDELWNYPEFGQHEMLALYESGLDVGWFAAGLDKAAGVVR